MKARDYFMLGCKLFGIWCLFKGITGLIGVIPTFISPGDLSPEIKKIYQVTTIVYQLIPILFFAAGIYLLRGGRNLYKFAYPEETAEGTELEEKFAVFVKMLGIYLLVVYIPDFLATISNYFVYSNSPGYLDMMQERRFAYLNAAPSIGGVLTGLYCLKSGKLFIKWAMQSLQAEEVEGE